MEKKKNMREPLEVYLRSPGRAMEPELEPSRPRFPLSSFSTTSTFPVRAASRSSCSFPIPRRGEARRAELPQPNRGHARGAEAQRGETGVGGMGCVLGSESNSDGLGPNLLAPHHLYPHHHHHHPHPHPLGPVQSGDPDERTLAFRAENPGRRISDFPCFSASLDAQTWKTCLYTTI